MPKATQRARYTLEFKQEAVRPVAALERRQCNWCCRSWSVADLALTAMSGRKGLDLIAGRQHTAHCTGPDAPVQILGLRRLLLAAAGLPTSSFSTSWVNSRTLCLSFSSTVRPARVMA